MDTLAAVLLAKIGLTIVLWAIPLMLFPASLLLRLGLPISQPTVFLRLLGMAFLALLVGYFFGLRDLCRGVFPCSTVTVGIVSNGGACAILVVSALLAAWKDWGILARMFMWISLLATGLVTLGLVLAGPLRIEFSVFEGLAAEVQKWFP